MYDRNKSLTERQMEALESIAAALEKMSTPAPITMRAPVAQTEVVKQQVAWLKKRDPKKVAEENQSLTK